MKSLGWAEQIHGSNRVDRYPVEPSRKPRWLTRCALSFTKLSLSAAIPSIRQTHPTWTTHTADASGDFRVRDPRASARFRICGGGQSHGYRGFGRAKPRAIALTLSVTGVGGKGPGEGPLAADSATVGVKIAGFAVPVVPHLPHAGADPDG
jgi:hypothetical protein